MGKQEEQLLDALRSHSRTADQVFVADVVSVNQDEDTIDIDIDGLEVGPVRLRSIIDSQGNRVVVYPVVGSMVLIGRIGTSDEMYVQAVGIIDKIMIRIGDMSFEATGDGFKYNDATHTTANADILKTQLNKLSKRVDDILNALKSASPDSSTGTWKASLTPLLNAITDKENFGQIEDTKIKH